MTNGIPVIVERAMYLSRTNRLFSAGHESAGITAPSTSWFLAEGATGSFFDFFILLANPSEREAEVEARYLLEDGSTVVRPYTVAPNSRFNIWVDYEDQRLAAVSASTVLRVTNGVPIIVERAMWWPLDAGHWYEAHNSAGVTSAGVAWGIAGGAVGGSESAATYVLVANTGDLGRTRQGVGARGGGRTRPPGVARGEPLADDDRHRGNAGVGRRP